ncbi:CHLOROPHYLL A/B BINDING PROTEIN [Salix koriyanagi]|uniref:Chlorophyll a-b binding protein, chloroplastic n=3 Tax=Salix TaxID=40685 RepID=A0A9Q0Z797_9ROSI|nr:CHLOROPHYLL A/B BINDING PROTEIN [Salix koriyanagi]
MPDKIPSPQVVVYLDLALISPLVLFIAGESRSLSAPFLCGGGAPKKEEEEEEEEGKGGKMATQALVSSSLTSSVESARKIIGARRTHSSFVSSRKSSFVVRAASTPPVKQGADRQLWFASKQSLSYLDGSLPGDFGFDPLGLSDPEGTGGFIEPKWLAYGEIINGRYAMLGAVGAIVPEILGKAGLIPPETALPWFKTGVIPPAGTYSYWADPYTLFVFEMALMGFAEHRRLQDWANPGSMGKQYFLGFEKYLGGSGEPAYPGGPLFNPLGFGKDEKSLKELKLKEVKNGRLAMLAILGYFVQGLVTGVGPYQNLLDHLADPVNNNVLTSLKFH